MSLVVGDALEREAKLLRFKAKVLRERIGKLESLYNMSSEDFKIKFEKGELGDEEDYFLWWSLIETLESIERRLREVEKELRRA